MPATGCGPGFSGRRGTGKRSEAVGRCRGPASGGTEPAGAAAEVLPRPPGERAIVRRKSYALARQTPDEAVADAELMDYDFYLFTEKSTGEDSVIYRTADGYRLALARPRTRRLGPADPSITVSKMPAPRLQVTEAAARLEATGQAFLFFVNGGTGRGNLIYHRYDGHYGLIGPAS